MEQVKDNDANFETCHLEVLDLIEVGDQDTLKQEEAVFDERVNKAAELIERLEQLDILREATATRSTTAAPDFPGKLAKRLKFSSNKRMRLPNLRGHLLRGCMKITRSSGNKSVKRTLDC